MLHLLARILISLIFLYPGWNKIIGFNGTVAYAASNRMPLPTVAIIVAILIEISGGILMMIGWRTRIVAWVLFVYLIPATLIFHAAHTGGPGGQGQIIEVLKNLAIMGGLLKFALDGPGAMSIHQSVGEGTRSRL